MAGRPTGVWGEKHFRDALRLVVSETLPDGRKKLRAIAETLVTEAIDGAQWAIEQVANRLDGRPAQDINVESTVTHELSTLGDAELSARIVRELAALDGRGEAPKAEERLH